MKKLEVPKIPLTPQGTFVAPQGTTISQQGTSMDPQGTTVTQKPLEANPKAPSTPADSKPIRRGAQADLYLMDYEGRKCVKKVYKGSKGTPSDILSRLKKADLDGRVVEILREGVDSNGCAYEVMPYYDKGSLADYDFRGNGSAVLSAVINGALAIDACHRAGVIHKDIKPANFLVRDERSWEVALTDFGISVIMDKSGHATTEQSRTPIYAAPELYLPKNVVARLDGKDLFRISAKADYYSLGMTALSLWWGEQEFDEKDLLSGKITGAIDAADDMPYNLSQIVSGLLANDPDERWDISDIRKFYGGGDSGRWELEFDANPYKDLNGNPDLDSSEYLGTKEKIGEFLERVWFETYFSPKKVDETIADNVRASFDNYDGSYVQICLDSKGGVFKNTSKTIRECVERAHKKTGRIAPEDPVVQREIALLRAIAKLTGRIPKFTLSGTHNKISNIEEYRDEKSFPGNRAKSLRIGLRAWLAVNLQENPFADYSVKGTYEEALMEYVHCIQNANPYSDEPEMYAYAVGKAQEKIDDNLSDRNHYAFVGKFRRICSVLLLLLTASVGTLSVFSALACPSLPAEFLSCKWIYIIPAALVFLALLFDEGFILAAIGGGVTAGVLLLVLKFLFGWFKWIFAALFLALFVLECIFLVSEFGLSRMPSKKIFILNNDTGIIEPLDFAVRNARGRSSDADSGDSHPYWYDGIKSGEIKNFHSTANIYIDGNKRAVDRMKKPLLIFIAIFVALSVGFAFIPYSDEGPNNWETFTKIEIFQDNAE